MNAEEIWAHFLGSWDMGSIIYAKKMGRLSEELEKLALDWWLK